MQTPRTFYNKVYIMYPCSVVDYGVVDYENACFAGLFRNHSRYKLEILDL